MALATTLAQAGVAVAVINPDQTHHVAKALLQRAKADTIDARTLVQLAATLQPAIRSVRTCHTTRNLHAMATIALLVPMRWASRANCSFHCGWRSTATHACRVRKVYPESVRQPGTVCYPLHNVVLPPSNLSFAQIGSQFESAATTACSIYSGDATTCRKRHWLS